MISEPRIHFAIRQLPGFLSGDECMEIHFASNCNREQFYPGYIQLRDDDFILYPYRHLGSLDLEEIHDDGQKDEVRESATRYRYVAYIHRVDIPVILNRCREREYLNLNLHVYQPFWGCCCCFLQDAFCRATEPIYQSSTVQIHCADILNAYEKFKSEHSDSH